MFMTFAMSSWNLHERRVEGGGLGAVGVGCAEDGRVTDPPLRKSRMRTRRGGSTRAADGLWPGSP